MKRQQAEDLFGYRGDEEREARRIVAAVEAAPDPPHIDEADIKGLDGSRIPGLIGICDEPEISSLSTGFSSGGQTHYSLATEGRRASGVFPDDIPEEEVRSILSESLSPGFSKIRTYPITLPEISIEVDESGRLAIGEYPSTFPTSHNGGKA